MTLKGWNSKPNSHEEVSCDNAALHTKLIHDELVRLKDTMDRLLDRQARELNRDIKTALESSFWGLPQTELARA